MSHPEQPNPQPEDPGRLTGRYKPGRQIEGRRYEESRLDKRLDRFWGLPWWVKSGVPLAAVVLAGVVLKFRPTEPQIEAPSFELQTSCVPLEGYSRPYIGINIINSNPSLLNPEYLTLYWRYGRAFLAPQIIKREPEGVYTTITDQQGKIIGWNGPIPEGQVAIISDQLGTVSVFPGIVDPDTMQDSRPLAEVTITPLLCQSE